MLLGFTYSHTHALRLGIPPIEGLQDLLELNPGIIRLCLYWNEIEKSRGEYDFTPILPLAELLELRKIPFILALGMKAPRWPEYYYPSWLPDPSPDIAYIYLKDLLNEAVDHFSPLRYLKYYQIENEPLDPSGTQKSYIPIDIFLKEIKYFKSLSSMPVIVNFFANNFRFINIPENIIKHADIIGVDIYPRQFIRKIAGRSIYTGPLFLKKLINNIYKYHKPLWITELQAEPWEKGQQEYLSDSPDSMNASILHQNYINAQKLHPQAILFWGAEYWLWKKRHEDLSLWSTVQNIFLKLPRT